MLHIEEKIKNQTYEVSLKSNGVVVGNFINVDGFYYFSESINRSWGFLSQEFLTSLVSELSKLNKPVNNSIDNYFKKNDTTNKGK